MENNIRQAYDELCCYTLAHSDPSFIHQHLVDAFAAQDSVETDKPIRLSFALIGLYLYIERQFTGKQVQLAHLKLGRHKRQWPTFRFPQDRGSITAADVLLTPEGPERDRMIRQWCASVWEAFSDSHEIVAELAREYELF